MAIPAEQISQDDVIIRQQEKDRRRSFERRPRSFAEYLETADARGPVPGSGPVRESLAELAERARRAPRIG